MTSGVIAVTSTSASHLSDVPSREQNLVCLWLRPVRVEVATRAVLRAPGSNETSQGRGRRPEGGGAAAVAAGGLACAQYMTVRQQRDGRSCGGGCRRPSSRGRSGRLEPERRRRRHPGEFKMAAGAAAAGLRGRVWYGLSCGRLGQDHITVPRAAEAHRDGDPRARDLPEPQGEAGRLRAGEKGVPGRPAAPPLTDPGCTWLGAAERRLASAAVRAAAGQGRAGRGWLTAAAVRGRPGAGACGRGRRAGERAGRGGPWRRGRGRRSPCAAGTFRRQPAGLF